MFRLVIAFDRIAENPPEPGMSRLATKRIQNELAAMQNDPPPGCVLGEMGDDIFRSEQSTPNIYCCPVPKRLRQPVFAQITRFKIDDCKFN